jgi:peptidoglycan/LPS O-acetylase OafA/YrhL
MVYGYFSLAPSAYSFMSKHIQYSSLFAENFELITQGSYFDAESLKNPLLHFWSLSVELQFYLIWPLILLLINKNKYNAKYTFTLIFCIFLVSFFLNVIYSRLNPVLNFYLPVTRMWEFMIGASLTINVKNRAFQKVKILTNSKYFSYTNIGLLVLLAGLFLINKNRIYPGWLALIPTIGAALIIADTKSSVGTKLLTMQFIRKIGLISYPLFLWHFIFLFILNKITQSPAVYLKLFAILLSFVFAYLTYIMEGIIRKRRLAYSKSIILLFCMTSLGYVGYYVSSHDGLQSRFQSLDSVNLFKPIDFKFHENIRKNICHFEGDTLFKFNNECYENNSYRVALWGDSQAAAIYPGLKGLQAFNKFGISQITAAGCAPLLDIQTLMERKDCEEFNKQALDQFIKYSPNVLIITSVWKHPWYHFNNTELEIKLIKTIEFIKLKLPYTKIVILGPAPNWNGSPQETAFNHWDRSFYKSMPPPLMLPADMENNIDEIIRSAASKSNANFISQNEIFCREDKCLSRIGKTPDDFTAIDRNHLSTEGAKYISNSIKDELFK